MDFTQSSKHENTITLGSPVNPSVSCPLLTGKHPSTGLNPLVGLNPQNSFTGQNASSIGVAQGGATGAKAPALLF